MLSLFIVNIKTSAVQKLGIGFRVIS